MLEQLWSVSHASAGQRRGNAFSLLNIAVVLVCVLMVAYDAIFPQVDALARISKLTAAKIQWKSSAPQYPPDGDALLVVQNANDPTASVVLLRHGTQTLSARPADFNKIDLISQ